MQYFGGKQRIARRVANFINELNPKFYLEPFCGSCNVGCLVEAEYRVFSDVHPQLIAMWQHVMIGWEPPTTITEDDYRAAQNGELSDYLTGFIGFACSYSGKWFGGYARNNRGDNFAEQGARSLLRKRELLRASTCEFVQCSYIESIIALPEADVIYCDPPYSQTTKYNGTPDFNSDKFWENIRTHSKTGKSVIVSEYLAPADFSVCLSIDSFTEIRGRNGREPRQEKLFVL